MIHKNVRRNRVERHFGALFLPSQKSVFSQDFPREAKDFPLDIPDFFGGKNTVKSRGKSCTFTNISRILSIKEHLQMLSGDLKILKLSNIIAFLRKTWTK